MKNKILYIHGLSSTSLKTNCDSFPKRNVIFSRLLTQNEM